MEKPTKSAQSLSAKKTLLGDSAITFTFRPSSPRPRLIFLRVASLPLAICTFLRPTEPCTILTASGFVAKHSSEKVPA